MPTTKRVAKKKQHNKAALLAVPDPAKFQTEIVSIDSLVNHPRNYREHPDDQLDHIDSSLREHGFYRNIVVAQGGVILAGHGVVKAARRMGLKEVPVIKLDIDPNTPQALRVLTGDNEISNLVLGNDRQLTELLKEIKNSSDNGLLGTGFSDQALSALVYISRTEGEVQSHDEAAQWVGMPEHDPGTKTIVLRIQCRTIEDLQKVLKLVGVENVKKYSKGTTFSMWYPPKEKNDLISLRFEQ